MKQKYSEPHSIMSSLHNYHSSRISEQEKQKLAYWRDRYQAKIRMKNFKKNIFGEHYNHQAYRLNNQKKFLKEQQKNTQIQRANRILLQKIKKISNRSITKQIGRVRTQNNTQMTHPVRYNKQIHFDQDYFKSKRNMSLMDNNKLSKIGKIQIGFTSNNKRIVTDYENQELQENKIVLYKGKRKINQKLFFFSIFIEHQKYTLMSENTKTQQKIQMPAKNYKVLFKETLGNKHSNIFNFLRLNQEGILQIVGVKKLIKDVIQKMQLKLPISQNEQQGLQHKHDTYFSVKVSPLED